MADRESLMQYHAAELMDAHSSLDKAGVPRTCPEGEKLSIAQRCKLAADMVVSLAASSTLLSRVMQR